MLLTLSLGQVRGTLAPAVEAELIDELRRLPTRLGEALAMRLAKATVEGAGDLMMASDEPPSKLRENVTSPGGVTKAALDVLMRPDGMPSLMEEAVGAAIHRDRELSGD